jgi:AsmA family protein
MLGAFALILGGTALFLATADLRPWIESYESKSLDRRLTIGSLKIAWGNPLTVEFRDVRPAGPPWGSSPEMIRIESGSGAIDIWSLWGGPLRFQKLELVKPMIILERNAEGTGNWAMGAAASIPSPPVPPVASTYAASRLKIPTLIDLAVSGGYVRFRTSSGQWLRIELDDLKIRAGGPDRPLSITGEGAYNDQRGKLTAESESFDALRDPSHPYGITFSIANPATSIDFKGTLIDPLAFDGVKAALEIRAQKLADLLKIFDAETSAVIPLQVAGALTREGGHWKLSDATGKLAATPSPARSRWKRRRGARLTTSASTSPFPSSTWIQYWPARASPAARNRPIGGCCRCSWRISAERTSPGALPRRC